MSRCLALFPRSDWRAALLSLLCFCASQIRSWIWETEEAQTSFSFDNLVFCVKTILRFRLNVTGRHVIGGLLGHPHVWQRLSSLNSKYMTTNTGSHTNSDQHVNQERSTWAADVLQMSYSSSQVGFWKCLSLKSLWSPEISDTLQTASDCKRYATNMS